eukprot:4821828-Alexandrium_andersonii.AAC.1
MISASTGLRVQHTRRQRRSNQHSEAPTDEGNVDGGRTATRPDQPPEPRHAQSSAEGGTAMATAPHAYPTP